MHLCKKKNIFKHIAKTKNISLPIFIIIWFPSSFKHWNPLWVLLIKVLIFCNLKSSNKVNKKVCAVYDCICKYLSFHEQSAKLQGLGNSWRTKLVFRFFCVFCYNLYLSNFVELLDWLRNKYSKNFCDILYSSKLFLPLLNTPCSACYKKKQMCTGWEVLFMYSFSGNCAASIPIFTFMCLWAIYIVPGLVHIFPPAEEADRL
jgi:hypothetical protein